MKSLDPIFNQTGQGKRHLCSGEVFSGWVWVRRWEPRG